MRPAAIRSQRRLQAGFQFRGGGTDVMSLSFRRTMTVVAIRQTDVRAHGSRKKAHRSM
jgi:hypothetical protein